MSVMKKITKSPVIIKIYTLIIGGLLMILVSPTLLFIPRKKKQMILVGTADGLFIDNVKYFFLHLEKAKPDLKHYFLTSNSLVFKNLTNHFDNILFYPSLKSMWIMLRSGIVVMDNTVLDQKFRFVFLKGAKHIQIWHGAGIKKFWNNNPKLTTRILQPYFAFTEKKRHFDSFISTSEFFTKNYFQQAFQSHQFPRTGYPRNDIFWQDNPYDKFIFLETDDKCLQKIKEFKEKNNKVIAYVPTFRGVRGQGNNAPAFDMVRLNQFAEENNLLFVFKLHPILSNSNAELEFDRILWHESNKDIYPILLYCDAMITDYSSIFMDYMILNRPILFYMYDKEDYEERDRELCDFYQDFMIGKQAHQQSELETNILEALFLGSQNQEKRKIALDTTFQHQDANSSQRLLQHITETYISN